MEEKKILHIAVSNEALLHCGECQCCYNLSTKLLHVLDYSPSVCEIGFVGAAVPSAGTGAQMISNKTKDRTQKNAK